MTNTTPLSPAAYAIVAAAHQQGHTNRLGLAAALRATADQLCLRWSELSHPADVLNNIADELDPQ